VYLTKEEKERKVIELLQKGANIREISKRVRMSFTDISKISRKVSGYPETAERSGVLIKHSKALDMFRNGHTNLEVAIEVGLSDEETLEEQNQFRRLINMDRFCEFYDVMKNDLEYYLQLRNELNIAGVTVRDCIEGVKYARSLAWMKFEYGNMQSKLHKMRSDSFNIWLTLQNLKQEKEIVANELSVLTLMKDNYLNPRQIEEPSNQEGSFVSRRRRQ
jgi:hypothetical protein